MDKASVQRLERLQKMLDTHLQSAQGALEALLTELKNGRQHPELWEQLHAAVLRDGKESELGTAYGTVSAERRLKTLPENDQATLLMHVADFKLGVLGDRDAAAQALERVLDIIPGHPEAFARLEHRYEGARLAELYMKVASTVPDAPEDLVRKALTNIVQLSAKNPVSAEACRGFNRLAPQHHRIADVLETHCKKTGRAALAAELLEGVLKSEATSDAAAIELRHRLVELYVGDAAKPEAAIDHVEWLLEYDPNDAKARAGAEKLLGTRAVASRAAAALSKARRGR
jgi:tetratricopeptide (TPR) repeat protein